MRYIHVRDRYCHCFGYSLCTKRYIDEIFVDSGISTDLEYELWYLNKTQNSKEDFYYKHDAILLKNIFHIRCGIKRENGIELFTGGLIRIIRKSNWRSVPN